MPRRIHGNKTVQMLRQINRGTMSSVSFYPRSASKVEEIENFIDMTMKKPLVFIDLKALEYEKQKDREITKSNPTHAMDDVLRSLVNACISSLCKYFIYHLTPF